MISVRQSSVVSAKPGNAQRLLTWSSSSCLSTGLVRKPNAPICVACTASGIVPCAVRMMTLQPRVARLCSSLSRPMPSIWSMRRSVMTSSGRKRLVRGERQLRRFRLLRLRSFPRAGGWSAGAAGPDRHRRPGCGLCVSLGLASRLPGGVGLRSMMTSRFLDRIQLGWASASAFADGHFPRFALAGACPSLPASGRGRRVSPAADDSPLRACRRCWPRCSNTAANARSS